MNLANRSINLKRQTTAMNSKTGERMQTGIVHNGNSSTLFSFVFVAMVQINVTRKLVV